MDYLPKDPAILVSSVNMLLRDEESVAKFWDAESEIYSKIEDLYAYMRNKRGSTCLELPYS